MSTSPKRTRTFNRILDAALECYAETGVSRITLDQVAKQAGVTRTTLYRYVNNRDDLLNKVLHRDALQVQDETQTFFRNQPDFGAAVIDSALYTIRGRMTRPINKILFADPDSGLAGSLTLTAEMFYDLAYPLLEKPFLDAQRAGRIREGVTLDMAVEWVTRITLSYVNDPGETGRDERALRSLLETMLLPALMAPPGRD